MTSTKPLNVFETPNTLFNTSVDHPSSMERTVVQLIAGLTLGFISSIGEGDADNDADGDALELIEGEGDMEVGEDIAPPRLWTEVPRVV